MKVGFIGLGKLGLPVAVTIARAGHDVMGHDVDPNRMTKEPQKYQEAGPQGNGNFNEWLAASVIRFGSLSQVCEHAEIIFIAVQTPHDPQYEGTTPMPIERVDFNYTHLAACIGALMMNISRPTPVVVISTCLPGTMRREIVPLLNSNMRLIYNPFFIAMGTVMRDFLNPEFILLGADDEERWAREVVSRFYHDTLPQAEQRWMTVESAELTKVAYNTFISMKLAFVNTLMEICDKTPRADVNQVTESLKCATDRLISGAYLTAGMGDGGGCFTADTKISLLDGREVPIAELVGQRDFWVYAYDLQRNEVVPGRAHSCRCTLRNVPVVKVELDNGEMIRCTADHPFLLRSGRYVEAGRLKPSDRLMPLYRRDTRDGYEEIHHPLTNKWERTHRIVHRWKYGFFEAKPVTHHKNFDKRDNPEYRAKMVEMSKRINADPKKKRAQSKLMAQLNKTSGERTKRRNLRQNPMWSVRVRKKNSESNRRTQRAKVAKGTHHLITNNPTPARVAAGIHNFVTDHPMRQPEKLEQMRGNLNDYYARRAGFASHSDGVTEIRRMYYAEGMQVSEITRAVGCSRRFVNYRLEAGANHTVVSVCPDGMEDVYNFEVDTHHNYALSSGVFVHNCHPRDNIAMSCLARKLGLSYDLFESIMEARECHAQYLARIAVEQSKRCLPALPIVLLGTAFKPCTRIETGSPALLVSHYIREIGVEPIHEDPHVYPGRPPYGSQAVFVITCRHPIFLARRFAPGSIVIDPWRIILPQDGVQVLGIGGHGRC